MRPPDYSGGGLVNLVAELEQRLAGTAPTPGLRPDLAAAVPPAETYLLVLLDGLGDAQLAHPAAASLRADRRGGLDSPFPSTTTVSLATVATGLPPVAHGLIAYQLWLPGPGEVVNTLKWTTLWGEAVAVDFDGFLPRPNLWERLSESGIEPVILQPAGFSETPLSRVLYRNCRREPYHDAPEAVRAALGLAAVPRRLILLYLPHLDFAAHVGGQGSEGYRQALRLIASAWEQITRSLPGLAAAVGSADHGHLDVPPDHQVRIPKPEHEGRVFYGDSRALFVRGEGASLASGLPATWVPADRMGGWWGPGPAHPLFAERAPDGCLLADPGYALLHRFSDDRLVGQHGGLTAGEMEIPLLVGGH